jgi:hypothetical protein
VRRADAVEQGMQDLGDQRRGGQMKVLDEAPGGGPAHLSSAGTVAQRLRPRYRYMPMSRRSCGTRTRLRRRATGLHGRLIPWRRKKVSAGGDEVARGGSKWARFRSLRAGIFGDGVEPTEMVAISRRTGRAESSGRMGGGEVGLEPTKA